MCVLAPTLARLYLYLRRQQAGSTEGGINSRQFQLQLLAGWAYLLCSLPVPASLLARRARRGACNAHTMGIIRRGGKRRRKLLWQHKKRERGRAEGGEGK